jgi:hypothetical protein
MDIFQMPALLKLADHCVRKRERQSHFEVGAPAADGHFGTKPTNMTLVEALERIGAGNNWIIL